MDLLSVTWTNSFYPGRASFSHQCLCHLNPQLSVFFSRSQLFVIIFPVYPRLDSVIFWNFMISHAFGLKWSMECPCPNVECPVRHNTVTVCDLVLTQSGYFLSLCCFPWLSLVCCVFHSSQLTMYICVCLLALFWCLKD